MSKEWMDKKQQRIIILQFPGDDFEYQYKVSMSFNDWNKIVPTLQKNKVSFHLITPENEPEISLADLKLIIPE